MSNQEQHQSRIPTFKSVEEAAAFWDSHSTTEFEEEFEPVAYEVVEPLAHRRVLSVRLDEETYQRLHDAAVKKGIGPSTLVRMWVIEALDKAGNEGSRATAD